MPDKLLYIRVQGKVQGPFCLDALRSMRDRGQFRRFHEISEDCQSWGPANVLKELFPSEPVTKAVAEATAFEAVSGAAASENTDAQKGKLSSRGEWYYVDEAGKQRGPISKGKLQDLLRRGDLNDTNHVWNPSKMKSWQAINSLPELGSCGALGSRSPAKQLALISFILGIL